MYVVDYKTPRQPVANVLCNGPSSDPAWLAKNWSTQFGGVPVPNSATGGVGEDQEIVIWSPSTNELWEMWQFRKTGWGYEACWGGKISDTSTSIGTFPYPFGVTASGLALAGGTITVADVESGSIDHAMAIGINSPLKGKYSWPANRTDGTDAGADAIPEGLRLRLDPSVDVNSLHLSPFAKMIAKAAQQYGFVVRDNTAGPLVVYAESSAPYRAAGRPDPYDSRFGSQATNSWMANFPWDRIQAMPLNYDKP